MSEVTIGIQTQGRGPRRSGGGKVFQDLLGKIRTKTARVAVIGLGHVGLPTAVVFCQAGYRVTGVDIREDLIRAILSTGASLDEPQLKPLLERAVRSGALQLTSDTREAVRTAEVVIICVQTPVTGPVMGDRVPDLRHLESVTTVVGSQMGRGRLVVIESTVPPGTTETVVAPQLQARSGLTLGTDFWLAHCPERMAPGNGLAEITGTARVVGGTDPLSADAAAELWKQVTSGPVIVTRAVDAEIAKLAENSFRAVNIAFANELALLCQRTGADVTEVVRLANSHPRVSILNPGPGPGGPCIPKDPDLLIHAAKKHGLDLGVLRSAQVTNARMPHEVTRVLQEALGQSGARDGRPKVCVLGTAYKAGVSSAHYSPAEPVIAEMMQWGADVVVYDPHCPEAFGARTVDTLAEAIRDADSIVILTDHSEFRTIDLPGLAAAAHSGATIVDTRRILDPAHVTAAGLTYIGLGLGRVDPVP